MDTWWTDLPATHDEVWRLLKRAVTNRRAAARFPALATVGDSGSGEARTVILREANAQAGSLAVYTDLRSSKVGELEREPRATLLIWDPKAHLQIRLRVLAKVLSGGPVMDSWDALSEQARADYGGADAPGAELEMSAEERPFGRADRFAVLRLSISEIETLHLGSDAHRRAVFRRKAGWRGVWLAP